VNPHNGNEAHERARKLIALAGTDQFSSNPWLATHLESCASCRSFTDDAAEIIHGLRAISVAADRSLVSATQVTVRRRAVELQRQRERVWLVAVSCGAVTLCTLFSAVALWRGFEWVGTRIQLAPLIWQAGFLVCCVMPALVAGILLLANGTQLADGTGSYRGSSIY
jgi:hypothetical protein